MSLQVRVVTPPEPIVTPAQIAGSHADDDEAVALLIAAVTEAIDGPGGWLGRSLGEQELLLTTGAFPCGGLRLPYGPVMSVDAVTYLDEDGDEQTVDDANYRVVGDWIYVVDDYTFPTTDEAADAVRIAYTTGYDEPPARARQAIILAAQHLKSVGVENLYLRAREVEGVGRREFTLSEVAGKVVDRACDSLLSTLRVYYP